LSSVDWQIDPPAWCAASFFATRRHPLVSLSGVNDSRSRHAPNTAQLPFAVMEHGIHECALRSLTLDAPPSRVLFGQQICPHIEYQRNLRRPVARASGNVTE
jgi:hypothetical protein